MAVVGTASHAADFMTGDEIKGTISGKDRLLGMRGNIDRIGRGKASSTTLPPMAPPLYKSAGRGMLHGTWAVKGNPACTRLEREVPNDPMLKAGTTSRATQFP